MPAVISETLQPDPAVALAGLLARPRAGIGTGFALPDLWHWVYLLERPATAELGADGHLRHGVPEAPGSGLLRMFAGGRVDTRRRLRLGAPAVRSTDVVGRRVVDGRSGPMHIVTTRSRIEQDGADAVVDEQDILYRAPGPPPPRAGDATDMPRDGSPAAASNWTACCCSATAPSPSRRPLSPTD